MTIAQPREYVWNLRKMDAGLLANGLFGERPEVSLMVARLSGMLAARVESRTEEKIGYVNDYLNREYSPREDVLVLPIVGEMSRYSYDALGNELLSECLRAAFQNDKYKAIVLKIDSGGGTADSCALLADAINARNKPVIAHATRCYSAAYFVASQCDEIIIEGEASSGLGSIGSLIRYQNIQLMLERNGIVDRLIRAKKSTEKALINSTEPLTPELERKLVEIATACHKEFEGYVRRGRAGKLTSDEWVTGNEYDAKTALKMGLIDGVGTLAQVVASLSEL